jgi:hypothetical protein
MIKLMDLLNENKGEKYLIMYALFGEKSSKWMKNDWSFDPIFKTQGLTSAYGKGANGQSWGKPSILCTGYDVDYPFEGSHSGWKYAVIFKKNINEIYLDDEIFYFGKYPSKVIEKNANNFFNKKINSGKDVSLGELNKLGAVVDNENFPRGNYVLNIKPNEIIKIKKRK